MGWRMWRWSHLGEFMGRIVRLNPLIEAIKADPRRIGKILVQKDSTKKALQDMIQEARRAKIPLQFVPRKVLDRMDKGHQGVIAQRAPRGFQSLDEILDTAENPLLLLLDGIEDPQNLGAILRTAEGAGVNGVILPERRSAGLSQAVGSASAGAVEHVSIARVTNLVRTMKDLKDRGFWFVGAEGGETGLWYEFDYTGPVGIVLGSEGKGLRPLVREACDVILSLPLRGRISSLNVSAAASVFLYEAVRQRLREKGENNE
jgi:23S rRNA (guanosine2251-2'-O)-methyltransferase